VIWNNSDKGEHLPRGGTPTHRTKKKDSGNKKGISEILGPMIEASGTFSLIAYTVANANVLYCETSGRGLQKKILGSFQISIFT
jgi:hypothetical protein